MPYEDPKTGEIKYTLKEKQDWHNQQAKKGATKISKKTGQTVKVSNFERGAHKAQADSIFRRRKAYKEKMEKANSQPVNAEVKKN